MLVLLQYFFVWNILGDCLFFNVNISCCERVYLFKYLYLDPDIVFTNIMMFVEVLLFCNWNIFRRVKDGGIFLF